MARTVTDLLKENALKAQKRLRIFNPDVRSFTSDYDGREYTIPSFHSVEFPYFVAIKIQKDLAHFLAQKEPTTTSYTIRYQEALKKTIKDE